MRTILISSTSFVIGMFAGIAASHDLGRRVEPVSTKSAIASSPASVVAAPIPLPYPNNWDQLPDLRKIQDNIDRMFNDPLARFGGGNSLGGFTAKPSYSLALNVRDLKDHFEVNAPLPDAKASDVDVRLKDDHTLEVEVSHKVVSENGKGSTEKSWGQYAQTTQLPAPVQVDKMKVERKDHDLHIILPKTNA
jgi:HSP20 family protein